MSSMLPGDALAHTKGGNSLCMVQRGDSSAFAVHAALTLVLCRCLVNLREWSGLLRLHEEL